MRLLGMATNSGQLSHQENSTLLEGLELASLAILAEPSSPARELGLTRHSLFARGKIH